MAPIKTVSDGLQFYYDTGNTKSYIGEPTTNLINSVTNSYPQVGNTFETYNTNQYNGGQYFSIGTISSVTSNQVTTATAHPLRTYDVVTPQTTAGGVTNGTNYYVKKTGTYTFTLHAYDASQDGSKGLSVLDPITNDTRISINSTSFPTMWWGQPHLPNSGLIKTIVSNGFNGHDCMRFNFYRPDGVTDGMAYGVYITIKSSTTYTYSYWVKAADSNAVGKTMTWSLHWWAVGYGTSLTSAVLTADWQRVTSTVTTPASSAGTTACYWFISSGPCTVDLSEIQYEEVSHVTPFVPTSRSVTQGLLDLAGNCAVDLTNVSYTSGSVPIFINNGTTSNNIVVTPSSVATNTQTQYTRIGWFYLTSYSSAWSPIIQNSIGNNSDMGLTVLSDGKLHFRQYTKTYTSGTADGDYGVNGTLTVAINRWNMGVIVVDRTANIVSFYLNGVFDSTSAINIIGNSSSNTIIIGGTSSDGYSGGRMFKGYISTAAHYNRCLSASEILQNYNSAKSRFGL
jgi:hypothetical protein